MGIARVPASRQDSSPESRSPTSLVERLRHWLAQSYHGTMAWMGRNPERRADPLQVLPNCRSILSVGLNYWTGVIPEERPGNGRIARYAWGEDYHRVFPKKLKALEATLKALEPGLSHAQLRGHGSGDGEILGAASWPGVDRQAFQPRLPFLRIVAAAGRNFNHGGTGA